MDLSTWKTRLKELALGEIFLYQELGSTNETAENLIREGALPFSLVVADTQTAGKGRHGRSWQTYPGKALAFSWILYPEIGIITPQNLGKLSGLGALAVVESLIETYQMAAEIKWPNDVLVGGKKVCGVLVDVHWTGNKLMDAVVGIGINVARGSVPDDKDLHFPATSLEEAAGSEISRLELLIQVLRSLLKWYPELQSSIFTAAWQDKLAYKEEIVTLFTGDKLIDQGTLQGISPEGALILHSDTGEERKYQTGEIKLRPVDRS
ncbi:MAG: biotin--[acetyl-CoA-carboxylase] ligase [Anaerolineales bacterium]|nr:biotin--[acetyl-CoA-carboxylase] ligase [Anaerolineales bacterium]